MTESQAPRCPACDFTVFSRRLFKCERCGSVLPLELRFSADEIAGIEADHDANTQVRAKLAREESEREEREAGRRSDSDFSGAFD